MRTQPGGIVDHDDTSILSDLINLLQRGMLLAIGAAIVAAVGIFFLSHMITPTFEAQAIVVSASQDPNRDFGTTLVTAPPLDVATYRAAVASRPVLAAALLRVDGTAPTLDEVDDLEESLTVRSEGTTISSLLHILVRDEDAVRARDLTNAIADGAVAWDAQRATRGLETIIDSLEAQIAALDVELVVGDDVPREGLERARADLALQLSSARALRNGAVGRLELLEGADVPREPVSPRPALNATLAALFAVFLTYGLLLLRGALDTRLRGLDDLVRAAQVPVLAEFPKVEGRRKLPREAASYLRTAIGFATADVDAKVLLVTSTGAAQGKSSVAIALAESFARQSYRVLLLDADLRKPVLGVEYSLDPAKTGTAHDALLNPKAARPTIVSLGREVTLDVLPSFVASPNPSELLSNSVRPLLVELAQHYDVIVIDSAPMLPVADALTIAPHATGVIFAVSVPDADRRQVTAALDLLRRIGIRVLGTVATNLPNQRRRRAGFGYGYGYGYGYGDLEAPVDDSSDPAPLEHPRRATRRPALRDEPEDQNARPAPPRRVGRS